MLGSIGLDPLDNVEEDAGDDELAAIHDVIPVKDDSEMVENHGDDHGLKEFDGERD